VGQNRKSWPSSGTSALPPTTDIDSPATRVRKVPQERTPVVRCGGRRAMGHNDDRKRCRHSGRANELSYGCDPPVLLRDGGLRLRLQPALRSCARALLLHYHCEQNCTSGKSKARRASYLSSPSGKNISLRRSVETALSIPAVPPRFRGAYRDRHERGAGRGGRGWRERRTRSLRGRRSRVVLTPRRWRQVGDDASHRGRRWWQKSPVTRESAKETVKTIACGNAG
jgi:hypothetical protein